MVPLKLLLTASRFSWSCSLAAHDEEREGWMGEGSCREGRTSCQTRMEATVVRG